jgi:queuine tRNA-ribosyltransferase
MLGPSYLTVHNLTFYQRLLRDARLAIAEDRFPAFYETKRAVWVGDLADDSCREP